MLHGFYSCSIFFRAHYWNLARLLLYLCLIGKKWLHYGSCIHLLLPTIICGEIWRSGIWRSQRFLRLWTAVLITIRALFCKFVALSSCLSWLICSLNADWDLLANLKLLWLNVLSTAASAQFYCISDMFFLHSLAIIFTSVCSGYIIKVVWISRLNVTYFMFTNIMTVPFLSS